MKVNLRSYLAIFSICLLIISGCSEQSSAPADSSSSSAMPQPAAPQATSSSASSGRTVIQSIPADVNNDIYEAALSDSRRPLEETGRDSGRKPTEVLKFLGMAPGVRVVDISSGDGYYTRILSGVVGSNGSVVANNSGRRSSDEFKAKYAEQYSTYDNVELNFENPEDISLPENSVDVVLLSLAMHHWHYDDASGDFAPPLSLARYENILRILKPGGIFAVIEHAAAHGADRQTSDEIHRIPADIAISDVSLAGFVLEGESRIHANHPEDDVTIRWTQNPRDATNRIVMKFRKP